MGLLDTGGFDNPNTIGLLSLGSRLSNSQGGFMRALGPSVLGALGDRGGAQQGIAKQQQEQLRMQLLQQQMEEAQAKRAEQAAAQQREQQMREFVLNNPIDTAGAQRKALELGQIRPMDFVDSMRPKAPKLMSVAAGSTVLDESTGKPVFSAPDKPADLPSAVREYEYAKQQGYTGSFEQWATSQKKAGATNIGMPKIEVKMGESVAGQIGPMAKESRVQAQGAVGMFDSADRIQRALDSGKVSSGPFTTQIQTVKQLVQKVGGGNDEGIRQTRQVIKGLAQMSVEARKELQGQGQVTESEAAAVAKAESGDINELTTGELQDLVTLTKRAAHMRARNHQNIIESMGGSEATKGMVPFYQVQNMDKLLKHSPQLPQIGSGNAVDAALKKYGQ
jgi:hypothetical protein